MIYVDWAASLLLSFAVDVMGVFVVPFAIYFSDGETLPQWASWWDNDREPLGDVDRKRAIDAAAGFKRGFLRYCWLAWRNPGNNMGYLLGFDQLFALYKFTGDKQTSDQGHEGTLHVTARNGVADAFCYYKVKRWSNTRCLRVFLGWKIHDMANTDSSAQIVCVINPFMTFEQVPNA